MNMGLVSSFIGVLIFTLSSLPKAVPFYFEVAIE